MNLVLPIFYFAVLIGLFVRRMTPALWALVSIVILAVIVNQYRKTDTLIGEAKAAAAAAQ